MIVRRISFIDFNWVNLTLGTRCHHLLQLLHILVTHHHVNNVELVHFEVLGKPVYQFLHLHQFGDLEVLKFLLVLRFLALLMEGPDASLEVFDLNMSICHSLVSSEQFLQHFIDVWCDWLDVRVWKIDCNQGVLPHNGLKSCIVDALDRFDHP